MVVNLKLVELAVDPDGKLRCMFRWWLSAVHHLR
jgi:hypothetical protein